MADRQQQPCLGGTCLSAVYERYCLLLKQLPMGQGTRI